MGRQINKSMWDRRQLRYLYYLGWWPDYSKTNTGYRIVRISGILLFLWDFVQLGPEFYALYVAVAKGSLSGTILNLNTTLMGVLCAVKIIGLLQHEEKIKWVNAKLAEMEELGVSLLREEELEIIAKKREKAFNRVAMIFYVWSATLLQWLLRPPVQFMLGSKVFLLESWIPWDEYSTIGWYTVYVVQFVHITTAMFGYILTDFLYLAMLEMIAGYVEILELALSNLDFSYPGVDSHPPFTLKFCVKYHQDILLICREVNKIIRVVIFASVIFTTVVMCLSVFELSSVEETDFYKVIILVELVLCLSFTILMFCWYCQHVADQLSSDVLRAAYNNNWYEGRNEDKKALNILCAMTQKHMKFGFIVTAELATFEAVIKSAFSSFNFLKALEVKKN